MSEPMLKYFKYDHLPPHLQHVSRPFRECAARIVERVQPGRGRELALEYLLLSKDAAVRTVAIPEGTPDPHEEPPEKEPVALIPV